MARLFECPTCKDTVTTDALAATCVSCDREMTYRGEPLVDEDAARAAGVAPIAPENIDAYKAGLADIENAKTVADQEEREYLRAKEYASKAKKRLEAAESKLRGTVQAVADRLRPKPLFADPDYHSTEELVALLAGANVAVTAEAVRGWTDAQRADARSWALAAHSEQPRLIPPFLWAGDPADDQVEPVSEESDGTGPADAPADLMPGDTDELPLDVEPEAEPVTQ
jgi:hypothetical protein